MICTFSMHKKGVKSSKYNILDLNLFDSVNHFPRHDMKWNGNVDISSISGILLPRPSAVRHRRQSISKRRGIWGSSVRHNYQHRHWNRHGQSTKWAHRFWTSTRWSSSKYPNRFIQKFSNLPTSKLPNQQKFVLFVPNHPQKRVHVIVDRLFHLNSID